MACPGLRAGAGFLFYLMSERTVEHVIKDDGTLWRRTQVLEQLVPLDTFLDGLNQDTMRTMHHIFNVPGVSSVNVSIGANDEVWTLLLPKLSMNCPWHTGKDGTMYPVFSSDSAPVIQMLWTPPEDMLLIMLLSMSLDHFLAKSWLFARSTDRNYWKLPLGNVYEDGSICLGSQSYKIGSAQDTITDIIKKFEVSQWNADLWTYPESTQKLFRFKAHNKGFDQLAPDGQWTKLAKKVGNAITDRAVI